MRSARTANPASSRWASTRPAFPDPTASGLMIANVWVPAAIGSSCLGTVVFVVRGEKVAEMPVETGAKMGDLVEIRSGPQAGEKVVLRPSAKLHDGTAVKPAGK